MLTLLATALAAPLVTGVVVDDRGEPVAGISVDAARVHAHGTSHRSDVVTDADGRFAVPDIDEEVVLARIQAREEDGSTSEVAFPTQFPASLTLTLRPAAEVKLDVRGAQEPPSATVVLRRDEVVNLGGLVLHDGPIEAERLTGPPGHWEITVKAGDRAALVRMDVPAKGASLRVDLAEPGQLNLTLPDRLRGERAICQLFPGSSDDVARGIPLTSGTCWEWAPPSYDPSGKFSGPQELVIKTEDESLRYRLDIQPDTWCHFALPDLEPSLPAGIIGATFDTERSPAMITAVVPGTPAEAAGLVPGDRVLEVDGADVASGLAALIAIRLAEDRVKLVLGREGKRKTVRVDKTPDTPPPLVEPERCGERPRPPEPEYREPYGLPYNKPMDEERDPPPPPK